MIDCCPPPHPNKVLSYNTIPVYKLLINLMRQAVQKNHISISSHVSLREYSNQALKARRARQTISSLLLDGSKHVKIMPMLLDFPLFSPAPHNIIVNPSKIKFNERRIVFWLLTSKKFKYTWPQQKVIV